MGEKVKRGERWRSLYHFRHFQNLGEGFFVVVGLDLHLIPPQISEQTPGYILISVQKIRTTVGLLRCRISPPGQLRSVVQINVLGWTFLLVGPGGKHVISQQTVNIIHQHILTTNLYTRTSSPTFTVHTYLYSCFYVSLLNFVKIWKLLIL